MNLFTGSTADAFFGGEVPPVAHALLHRAALTSGHEVGTLLWTAQALAPQALGVYYALYKHHAGRRELALAERAAQRGLLEAARQAGLPADWRTLRPEQLPAGVDFRGHGAARFWLFTLKALAFIALRSQRPEEARVLLRQISSLDPQAQIGGEVIAALLDALG